MHPYTHIAFIEKFQNMKEKAIASKVCGNYKKEWHIEKKNLPDLSITQKTGYEEVLLLLSCACWELLLLVFADVSYYYYLDKLIFWNERKRQMDTIHICDNCIFERKVLVRLFIVQFWIGSMCGVGGKEAEKPSARVRYSTMIVL